MSHVSSSGVHPAPRRRGPRRWLSDLPVSRKLLVVMAVYLIVVVVLVATMAVSMRALAGTRAYVEGEGHWAKAQKEAVLHLIQYADSGNEAHWYLYQENVNVTLGDRAARLELEKEDPDEAVWRQGFIEGRNHPDDVDEMAWLFRTFRRVSYIDHAIAVWTEGDAEMDHLMALATAIRAERQAADPDEVRLAELVVEVHASNERATALEDEFAATVGAAARWLNMVVLSSVLGLTALLLVAATFTSRVVSRSITGGIARVQDGAQRIAEGDFTTPIDVDTRDEIGALAAAFNRMSDRLAETQQRLRRKAKELEEAQELAHVGSWEWDAALNRFTCSEPMKHILGVPLDAMGRSLDSFLSFVHEEDRSAVEAAIVLALEKGGGFALDHRIRPRDGQERWMHTRGEAVRLADGTPSRLLGTSHDVTDRKTSEARVTASLREKEVLLKEIHHRVKNNLQVIASLLNLQARHQSQAVVRDAFRESRDRVRSMALVHEALYRSPDLSKVSFETYLTSLARELAVAYGSSPRITIDIDADDVTFDVDVAVSLGLIANELMSNSLKHAFPGDRHGTIEVTIRELPGGDVLLRVADDGVGLPPDAHVRRAGSIGLDIIATLVTQLQGAMTVDGDAAGASFSIVFPGRVGAAATAGP